MMTLAARGTPIEKLEILPIVVLPIAVLVMNDLPVFEKASEYLLHHKTMLENRSVDTGVWMTFWSNAKNVPVASTPNPSIPLSPPTSCLKSTKLIALFVYDPRHSLLCMF